MMIMKCEFCGEPITKEFAYSKPSSYCRRPDCVKNRGRLRLDLEEVDSKDDAFAEISQHVDPADSVVPTRSEIEEEMSPLVKARVLSTSTDRSIAPRNTTPVRDLLCSPAPQRSRRKPVEHDDIVLRDRVREIENKMFSWGRIYDSSRGRGRPDFEMPKAPSAISPEDAIRNQWILEKNKQGVTVATLIPDQVRQKDTKVEEIDFLKAYGLTPKHLATWIRDPRFAKLMAEPSNEESRPRLKYRNPLPPFREHFEIRRIEGADGTIIEHPVLVVPPSRSHARKFGSKVALPVTPKEQPKKRALKTKERAMYLDYADGALSTEQMVAKHGIWSDDDIRALELKVIRHAERAGLFVVPVQSKDGPVEPSDDAEIPLIFKTGGRNLGVSIHENRNRNSFDTGRVRETEGRTSSEKYGLPEWDDYGEDSAA